jgi:hypothetical protein
MKIKYWNEANNTCMLPMRCEKRTRPDMLMRMLNNVSPLKVLVTRVCPYELRIGKTISTTIKSNVSNMFTYNCQTSIDKTYLYICIEKETQRCRDFVPVYA